MNVLVDRHHADLFHSLQLLFEDRLGMTVYTPVGFDWWTEGYWRFGQVYGDDRLARQFLAPANFHGFDSHHPERPIHGVSLDEAMDWAYVVASVPDNEAGFARFAREHDAEYVLQVGNTNQEVDWSLDPIALVSSEARIRGRGVLYHQEFDSDGLFGFREPSPSKTIRSFVNCFGSTWPYDDWLDAEKELPGWTFGDHGIDGLSGNIETNAQIASLMAGSAWGWHDKVQGDGFGHVIHQWAAIGRPLIGHASSYRGLMAEPFWVDGETCIDLDSHTVPEAMQMVATMAPERHRAMCGAIRAAFDANVDYEAEADAIRDLLGLGVPA